MTTPPTSDAPASMPSRRSRRWVWLFALILPIGIGWYLLRPARPEPPPLPDAKNPKVLASLQEAHSAVLADRRNPETWGELGLRFTAQEYDDLAAECFREAHRLAPQDDRWPYMLALYGLNENRDPTAALAYLEKAYAAPHKTANREATIRLRLAERYLAEKRLSDAERLYREQIARLPDDPRGALGLGVTLLASERPAEAIAPLTAATSSPLTRKQARISLAIASRLQGDQTLAARYQAEAAQLPDDAPGPDPFAADAAAVRVDYRGGKDDLSALQQANRLADTIPLLERRIAEDPSDVRSAVTLGQNLALLGRLTEALPVLQSAQARNPNHVQATFLLGTTLYDLAQAEPAGSARRTQLRKESAEASRKAIELKPDLALAHFTRAQALQALGDLPTALPHYRKAVECRPELPLLHLGLLKVLIEAGQLDEARTRYKDAIRIIPADDPQLAEIRAKLVMPRNDNRPGG